MLGPTASPSASPSAAPTATPSAAPAAAPSSGPTAGPSAAPSRGPSTQPTAATGGPTNRPSAPPSAPPSAAPSAPPASPPSGAPSADPSAAPIAAPSPSPTAPPTKVPSRGPTAQPSASPATAPTPRPSASPSSPPTRVPRKPPTQVPETGPTAPPSVGPSAWPRRAPSQSPVAAPTGVPSRRPTPPPVLLSLPPIAPSASPTSHPGPQPRAPPSAQPTAGRATPQPRQAPAQPVPTTVPSANTTAASTAPSAAPTSRPSAPGLLPSSAPLPPPAAPRAAALPSMGPQRPLAATASPTVSPSEAPSHTPPTAIGKVVRQLATGSSAFAVSVGFAEGSGGSAAHAARLSMIDSQCSLDWEGLPQTLHPTQLTLFGSEYAGAIVFNVVVILCVGFAAGLAFLAMGLVRPGPVKGFALFWSAAASRAYYASEALFLGIAISAMRLIAYDGKLHPGFRVLGFVSILAACAVPLAVARGLRRAVPRALCYQLVQPPSGRPVRFLLGPGEWVATAPRHYALVETCSTALRTWHQANPWWVAVDATLMFLVAVASSIPTQYPGWCVVVRFVLGAVAAAGVFLEFRHWPHCRERDNWCDIALLSLQAAAQLADGVAVLAGSSNAHGVGAVMMTAGLAVLAFKCGCDLLCYLYVFVTNRRELLQEAALQPRRPKDLQFMLDDGSSDTSAGGVRRGTDQALLSPISPERSAHPNAAAPRRRSSIGGRGRMRPAPPAFRRGSLPAPDVVLLGRGRRRHRASLAAPGRGMPEAGAGMARYGSAPLAGGGGLTPRAEPLQAARARRASVAASVGSVPTAVGSAAIPPLSPILPPSPSPQDIAVWDIAGAPLWDGESPPAVGAAHRDHLEGRASHG
eukprot:TRINITY_DN5056_c0_g1_i1.p1 TRINITY_DN5056_c0_g1~~TRINITY_DN5056_c0_g1_i1.p1  ORF type:complete len:862 (+),score=93.86 TRINITY_DN5056_c0_g1_i1:1667-4252(+)